MHSYYQRAPADLPISDCRVRLHLTVRRFRCQTPACPQATFVERFPLMALHAQRTERLNTALGEVAFALGGQAGSRLAKKLNISISGDTLLRIIRRTPAPVVNEPRIVGVDDWAKRRGRVYGTILVDLERHRVADLLSDRTAETLTDWLKAHSVQTVARDRSGEYTRGITLGAPQANQVADRWHPLVNLSEAFERLLDRLRPTLHAHRPAKTVEQQDGIPLRRHRYRSQQEVAARDGRRACRIALHEKVHRLRRSGHNIRAIARHLQMSPMTVYRYLSLSHLPECTSRKRLPSMLDPFVSHLIRRWRAGCQNASQLWREIKEQGYSGTRRQVTQWVYERRDLPARTTPSKYLRQGVESTDLRFTLNEAADRPGLPVSRRLVWLFLRHTQQLKPEDLNLRDQLLSHPQLSQAKKLTQGFQRIVRQRKAEALPRWLNACERVEIPEFAHFAMGLRQDYGAVKAALSSPWSNGQTEGQVNRLKLLKRQMYGRANFDLLRLRLLHPP